MKNNLENSLKNSINYVEYKSLISSLLKKGKVTGNEQSEDLYHYAELNQTRMKRLDKTIEINQEVKLFLENLNKNYIWLVISEGWCGDAAQILPIINKMSLESSKIDFRIVLRDENDELMKLFLTNGSKSIPIVIIIEKDTLQVINHFGPRPQGAKKLILDYKTKHGIIDETAKIELQKWYLNDKGISTQTEIMELMKV
ncbi:thioredoxin family protein [Flavobacterium sp.]|uniref:thioredoxin family protein n=1 Tax=Flavobacterium sp. TaxID=239 RepID=UPI003752CE9C